MRKISTAILFTALIFSLQYGKISNYLYCEWQAKVVMSLPDCDCETILDGVFDDQHNDAPGIQQSKVKLADYLPCSQIVMGLNDLTNPISFFAFYPQHFQDDNSEPAFRPPAV